MIRLRALEPEDLDLLYHIESNPELWQVGNNNVPYSRYTLHDYLAHQANDIWQDRQVRLVIELCEEENSAAENDSKAILNSTTTTIGLVDLTNFDPKHMRAEAGIVVASEHQGKGFGLEALQQLLEYARQTVHLHQVYAIIDPENMPALTTFLAARFRQTATLHDWHFDGREYHDACFLQIFL